VLNVSVLFGCAWFIVPSYFFVSGVAACCSVGLLIIIIIIIKPAIKNKLELRFRKIMRATLSGWIHNIGRRCNVCAVGRQYSMHRQAGEQAARFWWMSRPDSIPSILISPGSVDRHRLSSWKQCSGCWCCCCCCCVRRLVKIDSAWKEMGDCDGRPIPSVCECVRACGGEMECADDASTAAAAAAAAATAAILNCPRPPEASRFVDRWH